MICKQTSSGFDLHGGSVEPWLPGFMRVACAFLLSWVFFLMIPARVWGDEPRYDWGVGVYGGQYYDTEPAGLTHGDPKFKRHYLVALTASRVVWRSARLPLALEIDGMIGHQSGLAVLDEIAFAPVLRWSSFPWNRILQTDVRLGPLGVSYTTSVSPLERGKTGKGSRTLNLLLIELDFSSPRMKSEEIFLRLHHRCDIYDLLNKYGANGEDFFTLGYRHRF